MKHTLWCLFVLCNISLLQAQNPGESTFQFLSIPESARLSAIGGTQISDPNGALSYSFQNPALNNNDVRNRLEISIAPYYADILVGSGIYSFGEDTTQNWHAGVNLVSYGAIPETNSAGEIIGEFNAGEYGLVIGHTRHFGNWSLGANFKVIFSQFSSYNSVGIGSDLGANYFIDSLNLGIGIVVKNLGAQLTRFDSGDEHHAFPLDLQLGISKRLAHLPFQFTCTFHRFTTASLYEEINEEESNSGFFTQNTEQMITTFDKIFGRITVGGELFLGKALSLKAGYDHYKRTALSMNNLDKMAGFSFGIGINIKKLSIDYAYSSGHPANGFHHFSLSRML